MDAVPSTPGTHAAETGWFGLAMAGLVLCFSFEHFVVHRQIILPTLAAGEPPLWMWASMFVPELVACFAAGWRLRTWRAILAYAVVAAILREGFQLALFLAKEPGHAAGEGRRYGEFAVATPVVALMYVLVLGLASRSARDARPLRG